MPSKKRYQAQISFPSYRFVPGQDPHPSRDPKGHSYGLERVAPGYLARNDWRDSKDYLFGVDLYNYSYYWEAHEAWEELWLAAREHGDETQTLFLQALIQFSAARLKLPMKQPSGFKKLSKFALQKLSVVAETETLYMGLDLQDFITRWQSYLDSDASGNGPDIFLAFDDSQPG